MKKRNNKADSQDNTSIGNLGNPFADLKFDAPPPPEPVKPSPRIPTKEEKMESELSNADKKLLNIFREKGAEQSLSFADAPVAKGPVLKLVVQRKGHGGKTVTLVHGLQFMEMEGRMELCSNIKNALGTGARFVDAVLEIQGDQRTRASEWLQSKGFRCQIP